MVACSAPNSFEERAPNSGELNNSQTSVDPGPRPTLLNTHLETGRMLVCNKNRRDRSGRQAGCSAERPGGPIRLVARPVSPQLTAAHPHAPRLAATPTRPRGTITLHRHPSGDGLSGYGLGETIAVARVPTPGSDPKDGLAERLPQFKENHHRRCGKIDHALDWAGENAGSYRRVGPAPRASLNKFRNW
jgi:hypothetical protein